MPRSVRNASPARTDLESLGALVALAVLLTTVLAGCGSPGRGPSPGNPSASVSAAEQAHTRFDVLFARDMIEHGAQAVALSDLLLGKDGVGPELASIARRIIADNANRTTELQTFLQDWGFAPMTVESDPPEAEPGEPMQPGEHPLATDADYRVLRESDYPRAADVFVELMTRQNEFTISAARSQLQSGSHPGTMALARSLIEDQQAENSAMKTLRR